MIVLFAAVIAAGVMFGSGAARPIPRHRRRMEVLMGLLTAVVCGALVVAKVLPVAGLAVAGGAVLGLLLGNVIGERRQAA